MAPTRAAGRTETPTRRAWRSAQLPLEHLERVGPLRVDAQRRGRLVAAVDHAVLAALVLAAAVLRPVGVVHQAVEAAVMLVGDEIARPLPALDVAGRVAPGRAGQLAPATQELQVHRRGRQPIFAQPL